jgi:hypothetical protein
MWYFANNTNGSWRCGGVGQSWRQVLGVELSSLDLLHITEYGKGDEMSLLRSIYDHDFHLTGSLTLLAFSCWWRKLLYYELGQAKNLDPSEEQPTGNWGLQSNCPPGMESCQQSHDLETIASLVETSDGSWHLDSEEEATAKLWLIPDPQNRWGNKCVVFSVISLWSFAM